MSYPALPSVRSIISLCLLLVTASASADSRVAVLAWADESYTARKLQHDPPRVETYVFMQGRFFKSATRDNSLSALTFRQIAEMLAVEIARENYLPAADVSSADLLLLVHWGATWPHVTVGELRGTTTYGLTAPSLQGPQEFVESRPEDDPASAFFVDGFEQYREIAFEEAERAIDGLAGDMRSASNASLLGYSGRLQRLSRSPLSTPIEEMLKFDVQSERYFVIVKAYDLKTPRTPGSIRRPVWTLHLNMRSPGQNFRTAIARMSNVAVNFAGKSTTEIATVRPSERKAEVTIGPLKVLGIVEE